MVALHIVGEYLIEYCCFTARVYVMLKQRHITGVLSVLFFGFASRFHLFSRDIRETGAFNDKRQLTSIDGSEMREIFLKYI